GTELIKLPIGAVEKGKAKGRICLTAFILQSPHPALGSLPSVALSSERVVIKYMKKLYLQVFLMIKVR
ncbi:MAG: hypothetical protein KKA41_08660, partial [Proteobacteria bacterium]|nr:hypothetical protein [Pseudomonadota bacterium]